MEIHSVPSDAARHDLLRHGNVLRAYRKASRSKAGRERSVPNSQEKAALEVLLEHLEKLSKEEAANPVRRRLLSDCLRAAEKPTSLFALTAPEGLGKGAKINQRD